MTKTKNYNLNQWAASDPIRRGDFNADNAAIDAAIKSVADTSETKTAAAQAAGDRGLEALRGALGDLCRLAYQTDGQGTYTGWRRSFDFDGLNSADRLEATTGAAVPEPDKGRVRLAADGWSGESVSWSKSSVTLPGGASDTVSSADFTPSGFGTLQTLTFTLKPAKSAATVRVNAYVQLLRGDEVLAQTDTLTSSTSSDGSTTGDQTYTFDTPVTLDPQTAYTLCLNLKNPVSNSSRQVTMVNSVTMSAEPVRCAEGSFTVKPRALSGSEVFAWAQYSTAGTVSAQVYAGGSWTDMEPQGDEASAEPGGENCTEGRFRLVLDGEAAPERLRFMVQSDSECFVYGWGVTAL